MQRQIDTSSSKQETTPILLIMQHDQRDQCGFLFHFVSFFVSPFPFMVYGLPIA